MATTTLPSTARLAIVVVARDLATSTLSRIAAQTYRLQDVLAGLSKEMQNLGIAWAGGFVTAGTFLTGITKWMSDLEYNTVMAVKRSDTLTKAWGVSFPKAADIAMKKIQGISAETGLSSEQVAGSLNSFIASGFKAEDLLGKVGETSAKSAPELLFLAKAASALGYPADDIAGTVAQIINIYSAAEASGHKITTSFNDSEGAIHNFSIHSQNTLRGVLDELNYVTNTMRVNMDDIQEAFQYAGGTIITSGTSLEDVLSVISQLILTGIKPGRIGRFLRSTATKLDDASISTKKWGDALAKAFGISEKKKDFTKKIKDEQKKLTKESKEYYKTQVSILKSYEDQEKATEKLLTNEKYLKDLREANINALNKGTMKLLNKLNLTNDEWNAIKKGGDSAVAVIREKYIEAQQKVTNQQSYINDLQKKGGVSNVQLFKNQLELVSAILKEQEGIDWTPPKGLLDQLLTTNNLVERWEVFKQILDTLPWDKLGNKADAVRRVLMESFFGERWADLGTIIISSLDPIKTKAKEIAHESAGSVEEEFKEYQSTFQYKWNSTIESIKNSFVNLWDDIKPSLSKILDKITQIFKKPATAEGLTNFIDGFIDGLNRAIDTISRLQGLLGKLGFTGGPTRMLGQIAGLGILGGPALMLGGTAGGWLNNVINLIGLLRGSGRGAATATSTLPANKLINTYLGSAKFPFTTTPIPSRSSQLRSIWESQFHLPAFNIPTRGMMNRLFASFVKLKPLLRSKLSGLFSGIFGSVFSKLSGKIGSLSSRLTTPIVSAFSGISSRISTSLIGIPRIGGLFAKLGASISSALGGASGAIGSFLGGIAHLGSSVAGVIGKFSAWGAALTTIAGFFTGLTEGIANAVGGINGLKAALSPLLGPLSKVATLLGRIVKVLFKLGEVAGLIFIRGLQNMAKAFDNLAHSSGIAGKVLRGVKRVLDGIGGAVSWVVDKILKLLGKADTKLDETKNKLIGDIHEAATGTRKDIIDLTKNMSSFTSTLTGSKDKVKSSFGNIKDNADEATGSVCLLGNAIGDLPDSKTIDINVDTTGASMAISNLERELASLGWGGISPELKTGLAHSEYYKSHPYPNTPGEKKYVSEYFITVNTSSKVNPEDIPYYINEFAKW